MSAALREARWQIRRARRGLVGWAVALAAVAGVYIPFYPAIGGDQLQGMVDALPPELSQALGYDRIGSAAGFVTSTVYGLLGMALLLVFAIGTGARTVAGEEESGLLELAAAAPVRRTALLDGRALALVVRTALLVLVLFAASAALVRISDMDVAVAGLAAGSLQLWLFTTAVGLVALAVGAATGRRVAGVAVGAALAVGGYVADAIAGLVPEAAWLVEVSPYAWFLGGDPLVAGVDGGGVVRLVALAVIAWLSGRTLIGRRDLGV
ncbi:MAG: ABC transporter permease subunit [Nitriliruptoraceae bacterium]